MKASFSIDQHDKDGDVFDECILLHLEPNTIIRFENYREFSAFVDSLPSVRDELRENLSPERRAAELATDTQHSKGGSAKAPTQKCDLWLTNGRSCGRAVYGRLCGVVPCELRILRPC